MVLSKQKIVVLVVAVIYFGLWQSGTHVESSTATTSSVDLLPALPRSGEVSVPSVPETHTSDPTDAPRAAELRKSFGIQACDSPSRGPIPEAKYPASTSDDIVFLNGYHWGMQSIQKLLDSIRFAGCKATIVFLSPHAEAYRGFLADYHILLGKYAPFSVIPFGCTSMNETDMRPNQLFLYQAVLEALKLPELARAKRVVTHDVGGALWYADLFKYIPTGGRTVFAAARSSIDPSRFDAATLPCDRSMQDGARFSKATHYFSGVIGSSSSAAMREVLSLVGVATRNYTTCSYEAGLNSVLLGLPSGSIGVQVEAWMSDFGPVAIHHDTACDKMKELSDSGLRDKDKFRGPLLSLCSARTVSMVMGEKCGFIVRNIPEWFPEGKD